MKKEQPNMTDKELDNFFRKTRGQFDIPYEPGDWVKMKAKLDQQAGKAGPNGSGAHKGAIGMLSFVIIMGLMMAWIYLTGDNQKSNAISSNTLDSEVLDQSSITKRARDPAPGIEADEYRLGMDRQISGENRADGIDDFSDQQPAIEPMNRIDPPAEFKPEPPKAISDNLYAEIKDFKASDLYEVHMLVRSEDLFVLKADQDIEFSDPNTAGVSGTKWESHQGRLNTTLVFAPDVSALKFNDIEGLGNSLGLNLEYFVHPNISLNLGILYAFKTYKGKGGYGGSYTPSPESMRGDCWMLDVPLNIRYYLVNQHMGRWYLSTGISSYMMLREKYNLTYKTDKGYEYEREVEVRGGNRHYLNIVNFSMGYERLLSDKIALQVEPYLKFPFSGIGEGGVNLKSSGILIGLKYSW